MAITGERTAAGADWLAQRAPSAERVVSYFGRRLELQQDNKTHAAEPRRSWCRIAPRNVPGSVRG